MPRPFPDFTGRKFGRLEVLGPAEPPASGARRWRCRCACGTGLTVLHAALVRARPQQSCGCLRHEAASPERRRKITESHAARRRDLTGQVFGLLTVIGHAGKRKWHVRCSCSPETELPPVYGYNLTSGNTTSCGCRKVGPEIGYVPSIPRKCETCRVDFLAVPKQRFCSAKCCNRSYYPAVYLSCPVCHEPVNRRDGKRYCGNACRRRAGQRAAYAKRNGTPVEQALALDAALREDGHDA